MKEIDFLPEWYKSGRRRQISHRTQYVALGGILVVMAVWNFAAQHALSKATAGLTKQAVRQAQLEGDSQKFARVERELVRLKKKAKALDEIDSKIDVVGVLGELSFLIRKRVVISKVVFSAETFDDQPNNKAKSTSVVRVAAGKAAGKAAGLFGPVRFRIVINGVASQAADVAELICGLEDSPYFCQVMPAFSRNKKITTATHTNDGGLQVSEFEITFYLANYRELTGDN